MLCHNYSDWKKGTHVHREPRVFVQYVRTYVQPNFVPFIVETGGYMNRRAHLFLDTLRGSQGSRSAADSRTQGYFRGPSPQDVALRGVMQALVRIQAYMHARRHCSGDSRGRLAIEAVV